MTMALAVYGKHPAKGDFLEYGLPPALKPALEGWLDTVLAAAKASLGTDWQAVWPAAPMLRFWLGEGIWGAPVAGVMASAQDRVGRRFPLVLLALAEDGLTLPPPVIDPDQTWYDAACAHLGAQLLRQDLSGPADLVQDAPQPMATDALPGPHDFWAVRPGADVTGLLADIALTDHRRANAGRSYWWVAGTLDGAALDNDLPPDPVDISASDNDVPATVPGPADAPPDVDDSESASQDSASQDLTAPDAVTDLTTPDDAIAADDPATTLWDLPDTPETNASPFGDTADSAHVPSLFAPPEPGGLMAEVAYIAPQADKAIAAKPQWSQVWAGPGLPSGAVLAWFFRGHAGND